MTYQAPQWDIVDMERGVYEAAARGHVWRLWDAGDGTYHLCPLGAPDRVKVISGSHGVYYALDVASAYLAWPDDAREVRESGERKEEPR